MASAGCRLAELAGPAPALYGVIGHGKAGDHASGAVAAAAAAESSNYSAEAFHRHPEEHNWDPWIRAEQRRACSPFLDNLAGWGIRGIQIHLGHNWYLLRS